MRLRAAWALMLFALIAGTQAGAQPPAPEALSSPIPRGTLDPGSPMKPLDDALRDIDRDRASAPALERYDAGDYAAAATLGERVLASEPQHHGLRFAVANSLAWTGRYEEALAHYRQLSGTPYDARARVGIANVLRWRGHAHLAEPYYEDALKSEPGNSDASEGLALARRDLRPSVTLRAAQTDDNQLRRDELSAAYRRWSADRTWRLEAGALFGRESFAAGARSPRGVFASAWNTRAPLSPLVEAAYYDADLAGARLFGALHVEPVRERLKLRIARVDWGRTAFSPDAARDRLTANNAGASAESGIALGALRARLDFYDISDGNRIVDGEAQITPRWQPLPWRVTWFGGAYARRAERDDPRYWSPRPTYGIAFVGLQRHWSLERAEFSASVRRGASLSRTAGDTWSAGANGRVWLRQDLALGIETWFVDAPRPASYRIHHLGAFLQQNL